MAADYATVPSLDEPAAEFRRRQRALLIAAEHAIPDVRDDVVQPIAKAARQRAEQPRGSPRPSELARDEERRVAACEHAGIGRPVGGEYVHGRQVAGITAGARHQGLTGCALQRREVEEGAVVVPQHESREPIAQAADAVVDDEVGAFARRRGLRAVTSHALVLMIIALDTSLRVLQPHRVALRALTPILVGDSDDGVSADGIGVFAERAEVDPAASNIVDRMGSIG
jgi:hypothetical protein